jgi:hypothetical protein
MARQSFMDLLTGIVVGAVNRLQFNEWQPKLFCGRLLWQLIAIFDKEKINDKLITIWNNWQP